MTRNEAIHKREDSQYGDQRHRELDAQIDDIYSRLPNLRLMPTCDACFFKRPAERVKRYRLRKKDTWVMEATRIVDAFMDSLTPTSAAFLDYFEESEQRQQHSTE